MGILAENINFPKVKLQIGIDSKAEGQYQKILNENRRNPDLYKPPVKQK